MNDNKEELNTPKAESTPASAGGAQSAKSSARARLRLVSLICTLAAWLTLMYTLIASLICSVVALVTGAMALRHLGGGKKAVTLISMVASGVLLVVVVAFLIGIEYVRNYL